MKWFAFRFDIDTPKCLEQGVPPLVNLAERLGVRFTFFLHVGRSISLVHSLGRKRKGPGLPSAASLSALQKLGAAQYVRTALLNPLIAASALDQVKRLAQTQELGLHGGRNHELWHHGASTWSTTRLQEEIEWSLGWLKSHGLSVKGFSSPGWTEHQDLPHLLENFGFQYRADRHGRDESWGRKEGQLVNLATNLTGEPGGVAYIEHLRALGKTDSEIVADLRERLRVANDYAVAYDHPYFAGLREITLLEKIIGVVKDEGFQIVTLGEMANLWQTRSNL